MGEALAVHLAGRAAVTDLGRPGMAGHGIPVNGAADQYSARMANILVGNDERAALIEITATDLVVSASRPALVAVTGAPATLTVAGVAHPRWQPLCVDADQPVAITQINSGLRAYLAVRGRLDAPRVFGSCAPDPVLGVGRWLAEDDRLGVDSDYEPVSHPLTQPVLRVGDEPPWPSDPWTVDLVEGPDLDFFADPLAVLESGEYVVGSRSNHIGIRLEGPRPTRLRDAEILSRGSPLGALEVPPVGELLVLQRGRPITAGYPVVAVVTRWSSSLLGQARPGQRLRLRVRELDDAVRAHRARERQLRDVARRVRVAFSSLGIAVAHGTQEERP
ncbi:biotin-dependent carboxyltransferase family protein [Pseudonocardia acaciae]|uniref:5-oxoprolinase subunit C family protein n=1 Tax=Pseudonocardia acaciae TaxID=551276 RepID=UPI00048D61F4|nr:biotin-dependent carboxyltransferase family protein [Pseudonocardia acaciae]